MIAYHRDVGDTNLAEALEYIMEHKEEWRNGELRPEDIPGYDYDVSLYVLNCVSFGVQWSDQDDN